MRNLQKLASLEARKKRATLQQDMRFMKILDENLQNSRTKLKDGHYQILLPFRQEGMRLPCINIKLPKDCPT